MSFIEGSINNSALITDYPGIVVEAIEGDSGRYHLRATYEGDSSLASFYVNEAEMIRYINEDVANGIGSVHWSGSIDEVAPGWARRRAVASWPFKSPEERAAEAEAKLAALWEALAQQAEERRWCNEYDTFAAEHGGPKRVTAQAVNFTSTLSIKMPTEYDQQDRQRAARRLSWENLRPQMIEQVGHWFRYADLTDDQRAVVVEVVVNQLSVTPPTTR